MIQPVDALALAYLRGGAARCSSLLGRWVHAVSVYEIAYKAFFESGTRFHPTLRHTVPLNSRFPPGCQYNSGV